MYQEITISKTLLAHQYSTMKVKDIQEYYGICSARLYKILDECGIERKWDKKPRREFKKIVVSE